MFSLADVSDPDYYLDPACAECLHSSPADYELDAISKHGEPPGRWDWRGVNALGQTGTIVPNTASGEAFRTVLGQLRHPDTGAQLGRKPPEYKTPKAKVAEYAATHPDATPEQLAQVKLRAEQNQSTATHALDGTFSPGKSWSVLEAALEWAGRRDEAELLWAALEKGAAAALDLIHEELAYTRIGTSGPKVAGRATLRYERPVGMPIATFRHHRSREGDPQAHIHAMLLNRVMCADGQWRSLHGMGLYRFKKMVDVVFTRVAEAEATRTLGLRYAWTADGKSREIVGVSEDARACFSSRSRALSEKAQELVDEFTSAHGRAPTDREKWKMLQQATLDTRRPKRDVPERDMELSQFEAVLREETRESFQDVLEQVDELRSSSVVEVEPLDRDAVVEAAVADLEDRRASWNRSDLWFAVSRRMPDMLACDPAEVRELIGSLVDDALGSDRVVSLEAKPVAEVPVELQDPRSGRSVFEAPEGERYTTTVNLDREDALVAWLGREGAAALPAQAVREALDGLQVSDEQRQVAVDVLTSTRRVELVNAPAGAGKSRLTGAIGDVLERTTGQGLVGFAVAQNAAEVLAAEGVQRAMNIAGWFDFLDRDRHGEAGDVERAWFTVPRGATVVVDEASMVDTPTLTRLLAELSRARVSKVILVGDTEQLAAVDAGGGFGLMVEQRQQEAAEQGPRAEEFAPQASDFVDQPAREKVAVPVRGRGIRSTGGVHALTEVRRFDREWERTASAKLREGDVSALTDYDTRGRVFGEHDQRHVLEKLVKGFTGDHLAGRDSVIVVGSSELAADVSSRVRERLVRAGHVDRHGVRLADQTVAGVGDIVQTRRNDVRGLGVVNRELWQVVGTAPDGGLEVRRLEGRGEEGEPRYGAAKQLPAAYVKADVALAYAATAHAVQGQTRDTSWTLVDRWSDRAAVYVGGSRGRHGNHFGVVTAEKETPLGRLAAVVGREREVADAARSAMTQETERARHLGHLGPQWSALVTEEQATQHRHVLRTALGPHTGARVLADEKVGGLLHLLRGAEVSGHPVRALLEEALPEGVLDRAVSPASLAYTLVDDALRRKPWGAERRGTTYEFRTPQAPRTAEGLYALRLAKAMDDRAAELGQRQATSPEPWALERFGPVPDEVERRYGWVGQVAAVAAFREQFGWSHPTSPIGPAPTRQNPEKLWAWHRAADVLGIDPREREFAGLSDLQLADREAEWQRTQAWMPANVDLQLREAHTAVVEADRQITSARTAGRDTVELQATYAEMAEWVDKLEEIAQVRAEAYERTADVRERAQEARAERERREEVERARLGLLHRDDPGAVEPEWDPEFDEPEPEGVGGYDELDAGPVGVENNGITPDELADPQMVVMARWFANHDPQRTVVFGSAEWVALEDGDPAKLAAVTAAAMRARQLVESGEAASLDERMAVRDMEDPTVPVDEAAAEGTHWWSTDHLMIDGPEFGSVEWVALPDGDPGKDAAEAVEALRWWAGGDTLDARRERVEAAEEAARVADVERWRREGEPVDEVVTDAELAVDAEPEWVAPEPDVVDERVDRSRYAWVREANAAASDLGYEADKPTPVNAVEPELTPEPRVTVVEREPEPVEDEPTPEPDPEEQARVEREQRRADLDRELERARRAEAVLADMRAAETQREQEPRDDEDRRSREALAEREAEVQQVELDA